MDIRRKMRWTFQRLTGMLRGRPLMKTLLEIKPHGFKNERHVVLPDSVVSDSRRQPLLRELVPSAVGHFPHAAGHLMMRPHGMKEYLLMVCVGGRGWCRFGHQTWRIETGQAIIIPAGLPHSYGSTKREPWTIYWAHFLGTEAEDYFRALGLSVEHPLLEVSATGEIAYHFESMLARLQYGYTRPTLLLLSMTLRLILSLLNLLRQPVRPVRRNAFANIDKTVEFMRQNLARPLAVADFARIGGLSPTHYTELFRRRMGYSPMAFFLRLRIQAAGEALATTAGRIQEVAQHFGFEDPYYFSRLFKKIAGCPPQVYRDRHRQHRARPAAAARR